MHQLTTVYSSNIPMDCHILKGRLETEGIECFIYDENLVWVHPFRAVAIGGVKLKVPDNKLIQSKKIISLLNAGNLTDDTGEYPVSEIFDKEIIRQNEILSVKNRIRNNTDLLDSPEKIENNILTKQDIQEIIESENEYKSWSKKKLAFTWKQFFYEFFDFNRDVFKYLRPKPAEYYIEKEIVDNYIHEKRTEPSVACPNCHSNNTAFGFAIDNKWDILYVIISVLLTTPLFLFRKKYHCFNCGYNFKNTYEKNISELKKA